MRDWLRSHSYLTPAVWIAAVPWLLFPTVSPDFTAVSLVLLLLLLFAPKKDIPPFSLPITPINGYLLVFLVLTGIAYLASPLPEISLPKLTVIILGAITFFLALPLLDKLSSFESLITFLAICAGFVALAGFFTLEWPARQIINLQPIIDRLPHLSGDLTINYNEMGGTLLIFFPFVTAAMRKQDGHLQKLAFSLILIMVTILLFFTQSRGAITALLVAGITWWLWGRIQIRIILSILIIICLALLLMSLIADLSFADLINWLSTIDAGSKQGDAPANSWITRLEIWQAAVRLLADYPVIGGGLYTFDPVSRANYVYESVLPSFNLTHAHNLFLQTGSSLGIGGLLALTGIWSTALILLWQTGRSDNERVQRLSAVFAASTAGYLFFNLFDTITFGQKPGLFVWIVLAGSIGLSRLAKVDSATNEPAPGRQGWLAFLKPLSFVPLLVFTILLLSPTFPRNLANLKLDQVRQQSDAEVMVDVEDFGDDARRTGLVHYLAGDKTQALANWERDPQGAAFLQSQGTIALMSGRLTQAIAWYDLALELASDSTEIYLWRGISNEEKGNLSLAEADYRRAISYIAISEVNNPTKAYIYYRLGLVLVEQEAWHAAADAFTQATRYQPEEEWYYQLLGDVLTALGDQRGASAAYQKAAE